jgi:hypothetical protein
VGWLKEELDRIGDPFQLRRRSRQIHFILGDFRLGKSTFAQAILQKWPKHVLYYNQTQKLNDLPVVTEQMLIAQRTTISEIMLIFFDIPKTQGDRECVYTMLENWANRHMQGGKYKAMVRTMRNLRRIYCFMNDVPDLSALAPDRYNVREIMDRRTGKAMNVWNEVLRLDVDPDDEDRIDQVTSGYLQHSYLLLYRFPQLEILRSQQKEKKENRLAKKRSYSKVDGGDDE